MALASLHQRASAPECRAGSRPHPKPFQPLGQPPNNKLKLSIPSQKELEEPNDLIPGPLAHHVTRVSPPRLGQPHRPPRPRHAGPAGPDPQVHTPRLGAATVPVGGGAGCQRPGPRKRERKEPRKTRLFHSAWIRIVTSRFRDCPPHRPPPSHTLPPPATLRVTRCPPPPPPSESHAPKMPPWPLPWHRAGPCRPPPADARAEREPDLVVGLTGGGAGG